MAKVTKGTLKNLVKECLIEILAEGLGNSAQFLPEQRSRQPQATPARSKRKSIFDQIDRSFASNPAGNKSLDTAARTAAKVATDDPILQSILESTATTTLQDQLQHEVRPSNYLSSQGEEYSSFADPESPTQAQMLADHQTNTDNSLFGAPTPPAAGIDIGSIFGEATSKWSEVLKRADAKKLP